MQGIFLFIISYLGIFLAWLVIVAVFYSLSLIFKKNLATIPTGFVYIISYLIQIFIFGYSIYILWQIVINHEWLLLVLALIFGGFVIGWWQWLYGLLLAPFIGISDYFLNKVSMTDFGEDIVMGEILDEDNKVVDITEGETSIKTRFAKYFVAFYLVNLSSLLLFPTEREGLAPIDYITKPFLQIIGSTILIGIPYGIYRTFRRKSFFTKDKRYFLIQIWKVSLYIFIALSVFVFILAVVTSTL